MSNMYSEVELIKSVTDKKTRISLYTMFLVEYSGWLQHLNSVGKLWGSAGEEMGAQREAKKCSSHITELKSLILVEATNE